MSRLDEWKNEILEARSHWAKIPASVTKPSVFNAILQELEKIPDAKRYLMICVALNYNLESEKKTAKLKAIRQYLVRLEEKEANIRIEKELKAMSKQVKSNGATR